MVLPYILTVLSTEYTPGHDEAYQVEAALRLATGHDYEASWQEPKDLSTTSYTYLSAWPIGYSYALSILLSFGVPLAVAAKFLRLGGIAFVLVGWAIVSNRYLLNAQERAMYGAFLGFFSAICATPSPTDLFILGIFSVLAWLLLAYFDKYSQAHNRQDAAISYLLAIGIVAGAAVAVKYTAIAFSISIAFFIAIVQFRRFGQAVIDLLKIGIASACIVSGLFLSNYINTGRPTSFSRDDDYDRTYWWIQNIIPDSLGALLLDAPYLPKVVLRALVELVGSQYGDLLRFAVLFVFSTSLLIFIWRSFRNNLSIRPLIYLVVSAYLAEVVFLGWTMVIYFSATGFDGMNVLSDGRYYQWIVPMLGILVIAGARSVETKRPVAGSFFAITTVVCLFLATFYYAQYIRSTSDILHDDMRSVTSSVDKITPREQRLPFVVYSDPYFFPVLPWKGQANLFAGRPSFPDDSYFSTRTFVFMICTRWDPRKSSLGHNYCNSGGFDQTADRYYFHSLEPNNRVKLYWKLFQPGPVSGARHFD